MRPMDHKGHAYIVESFEGNNDQIIQFIHKEIRGEDGKLVTVKDGTTNEELLRVLVDRLLHLQDRCPCRENAIAITKIEEALMWLERGLGTGSSVKLKELQHHECSRCTLRCASDGGGVC